MRVGKPEVLAPVGSLEALEAAIAAGADAVYFGSGAFHARSGTVGFEPERLPELVARIHTPGLKAYMTLNTLIFPGELEAALKLAGQAYEAGVDALIVQDVGLATLLRDKLPGLPLHASTQMAVHSPAALRAVARLGLERVVLPRELTLPEIREMTRLAASLGVETEVFVHGALCVCYSGHCQMSAQMGGRSANRGACAQPCRQTYRLLGTAGKPIPLLSPKDISYLNHVSELVAAGVSSFKIEGRMRSPEYVATTVRLFRQERDGVELTEQDREDLLQVFNRGGAFGDHRLTGERGRSFLSGIRSGHTGLEAGRIQELRPATGELVLENCHLRLEPGDVLSLVDEEGTEQASAPVGRVEQRRGAVVVRGFHPQVLRELSPDLLVYRTKSARLVRETTALQREPLPIRLTLEPAELDAAEAERMVDEETRQRLLPPMLGTRPAHLLRLEWLDEAGRELPPVTLCCPAEAGEPLSDERVTEQLSKLGGTGLLLKDCQIHSFCRLRISSLNRLRRELVGLALEQRGAAGRRRMTEEERVSLTLPSLPSWGSPTDQAGGPACPGKHLLYLPGWRMGQPLPSQPETTYLLPLAELLWADGKEPGALRQLLAENTILVVVPAGAPLSFYEQGELAYSRWLSLGLAGQVSSGLVRLAVDGEERSEGVWLLLPDANVANEATLRYYASRGASALALAHELDEEAQAFLIGAFSGLCWLRPWGNTEAMTFQHCPVGFGVPGCRRCENTGRYWLEDVRGRVFPFVPLPRQSCSGRLYGPNGRSPEPAPRQDLDVQIRTLETRLPGAEEPPAGSRRPPEKEVSIQRRESRNEGHRSHTHRKNPRNRSAAPHRSSGRRRR